MADRFHAVFGICRRKGGTKSACYKKASSAASAGTRKRGKRSKRAGARKCRRFGYSKAAGHRVCREYRAC